MAQLGTLGKHLGPVYAPCSVLQLVLSKPAHLGALSCLHFFWKLSLLVVSLILFGIDIVPTAHHSVTEEIRVLLIKILKSFVPDVMCAVPY
jgi:hypothetical protein